jgi:hypothetical protein
MGQLLVASAAYVAPVLPPLAVAALGRAIGAVAGSAR